MFRVAGSQFVKASRALGGSQIVVRGSVATVTDCKVKHYHDETPEQFDERFINFFNRPDLDGWLVRQGMTELQGHDMIPEPTIIAAALRACRRVNDYALAVRFLEAMKVKCGGDAKKIYPYLIQEVKPVLDELGISTPEEMGYDKPEFFVPSVDYWDWENYPEGGNTKKAV